MAEIIDAPATSGKSFQPDTWIVMFDEHSTKQSQRAHMELVKALNARTGYNSPPIHYPGITEVFDPIKGHAGVFRPEVVAWVRSQSDVSSVS